MLRVIFTARPAAVVRLERYGVQAYSQRFRLAV